MRISNNQKEALINSIAKLQFRSKNKEIGRLREKHIGKKKLTFNLITLLNYSEQPVYLPTEGSKQEVFAKQARSEQEVFVQWIGKWSYAKLHVLVSPT